MESITYLLFRIPRQNVTHSACKTCGATNITPYKLTLDVQFVCFYLCENSLFDDFVFCEHF